jgi:hypothetical protein
VQLHREDFGLDRRTLNLASRPIVKKDDSSLESLLPAQRRWRQNVHGFDELFSAINNWPEQIVYKDAPGIPF